MKRVFSIGLLFQLFLLSCGNQKIDTTAAREEMEAREIKVVSDAQIIEQAMKLGSELSSAFLAEENDGEFSFDLGSDTTYEKAYYLFEETNNLEGKELQLFEAYNYNRNNGMKSEPNVQKLENGTLLLYTSPIIYKDSTLGMWSIKFSRKEIVLSIED